MAQSLSLPQLIIFDLDFTLWDCGGTWCDCLQPPFCQQHGQVVDSVGHHIHLYDHVVSVLNWCDDHEIPLALASRTEQPTWAQELIVLLGLADRFAFSEIYPSSKFRHFAALHQDSGVEYDHMLFFDDEMRNIREVSELGVTAIHVEQGFSQEVFEAGLREFSC